MIKYNLPIPGATDQLFRNALAETVNSRVMPLVLHERVSHQVDFEYFRVLASREEAVSQHTKSKTKYSYEEAVERT